MSYAVVCIVFYLIGSIPAAYIVVKFRYKKDITTEGSGNVGARNTFAVTKSKLDGTIVLAIDFLKGLLPVIWFLSYSDFFPQSILIPAASLVVGHNYSVWLKFKGGRGLATAAGIMIVINYLLVIIWLVTYFIFNLFIKNIHISTVIALLILPLTILVFPEFILKFTTVSVANISGSKIFLAELSAVISVIIMTKHIEPLRELIRNRKQ